jgi:hypothetical protein
MFSKYKNFIIGLLVIGLLFVVYTIFFQEEPEPESLLQNTSGQELDQLGEEIIRSLSRIQSIELNQSVLSDPIYLRLIDNPVIIPQPRIGRENPFQPLPIESLNVELEAEPSSETGNEE